MLPFSWAVYQFAVILPRLQRGHYYTYESIATSCTQQRWQLVCDLSLWAQSHFNLWKVREAFMMHLFWDSSLTENLFQSVFDFKMISSLCNTALCKTDLWRRSLTDLLLAGACSLKGYRPTRLLKYLVLKHGQVGCCQDIRAINNLVSLCSLWNRLWKVYRTSEEVVV